MVTTRAAETALTRRAREALMDGPRDVVSLIGHVCQLPNPPKRVAEHMAIALLAGLPEFVRTDDGHWRLLSSTLSSRATGRTEGGSSRTTEGAEGERERRSPSQASPGADASLRTASYAVVDVETTGGAAYGGDRITEIAAIVVRDRKIVDRFESLVNPERPIPPMVSSLTHITWSMVRDAPRFRDICAPLLERLDGCVFVAHNVGFDWRFVESEVNRASGRHLEGRRICTVRMAKRFLPQLRRRSLDALSSYFGIENRARHRAGGDAEATAKVLIRLLDAAEDNECTTLGALESSLALRPSRRRRRRRWAMPRPVDDDTTA